MIERCSWESGTWRYSFFEPGRLSRGYVAVEGAPVILSAGGGFVNVQEVALGRAMAVSEFNRRGIPPGACPIRLS